MRVHYLALLATALFVGCAERDATTTRRPDAEPAVPAPAPTTTTPRTTADQTTPGGAVNDQAGPMEERSAARPVIEDRPFDKTATEQGESQADIDTTAAIRRQVLDSDVSAAAQNVTIITRDGKVTLQGYVQTDNEKDNIERIAKEVAGEDNVTNDLEIRQE